MYGILGSGLEGMMLERKRQSLQVKRLTESAIIPTRGSKEAIGYDLYADLPGTIVRIPANTRKVIPTGLSILMPARHYGRIAPRSGLAVKNGIVVLAGVIDRDYTGELLIALLNTSDELLTVTHGMRVAQLILERATIAPILEVSELDETTRGINGFGSTDT